MIYLLLFRKFVSNRSIVYVLLYFCGNWLDDTEPTVHDSSREKTVGVQHYTVGMCTVNSCIVISVVERMSG